MSSWFRREANGALTLSIHAQPGAKRTEIAGLHGAALRVRVAAPASEDRANEALIEFFAEVFRVPRRAVTLVSGAKSREKRIAISGTAVDPATLIEAR